MIPIVDEQISLEVKIAFLEGQPLSPAAKAFLELITGESKEKEIFLKGNGRSNPCPHYFILYSTEDNSIFYNSDTELLMVNGVMELWWRKE